jgi:uncharacterized protein YgiM (DUF1202 family)
MYKWSLLFVILLLCSCEKKQNNTAVDDDVVLGGTVVIRPVEQPEQEEVTTAGSNIKYGDITFEEAFEGIDTVRFTNTDAVIVEQRVIDKEFLMPNHHGFLTDRGGGWWGGIRWNNEWIGNYYVEPIGKIVVIMFERYAGKRLGKETYLFLCDQILFYPVEETDYIMLKPIDGTDDGITTDGKYTMMSLYAAKNNSLKANTTYYPQSVLRINNQTGKMEILSNVDKTYSFTSNHFEVMYGVVNDDAVRVRSEPNLNATILGHYNNGDKVFITWVDTQNGDIWYRISFTEEGSGWIYGAYVDIIE